VWEGIGAQKAIIVDLRLYYAQLANFTKEIMIQNYVQGGDHDIFVCGCYVGRNGQLLGNFTDRKLRQDPPLVGTGSVVGARSKRSAYSVGQVVKGVRLHRNGGT
jgi:predicted ATP-grasp superfamily ATP-dependent carboligase